MRIVQIVYSDVQPFLLLLCIRKYSVERVVHLRQRTRTLRLWIVRHDIGTDRDLPSPDLHRNLCKNLVIVSSFLKSHKRRRLACEWHSAHVPLGALR